MSAINHLLRSILGDERVERIEDQVKDTRMAQTILSCLVFMAKRHEPEEGLIIFAAIIHEMVRTGIEAGEFDKTLSPDEHISKIMAEGKAFMAKLHQGNIRGV